MKIKQIVFSFLFLIISSTGNAQDYKKTIEIEFTEYLNSIVNKNFAKSMNYVIPEFFEIIPKSQMIKLMEQTFNNPSMEFELKNPKILSIDDAQKIEEKFYSLLSYSNQMNMKILNEGEETEDEKKMRIGLTQLSFEQNFGSENVKYNKETDFFEILVEKQVYTISKDGETDWKFLVIEKKQKVLLEKLLPKELVDKI
ncbi:hypothetical protein SAMN04488062_102349 [Flavobacterium omnivorum]|uniref:DUF4252 domain-containing protein n=1 Tax=Flavobacterium omnivorum TaxID=178355 RepID=A0A1G7XKF5_9FLAO|nr:hypothetical protein [Flavobacterium omnivorum]SDG84702.1 hypothetical protein SAMN04488062_102349 [Flavobacterium omnivorum]